MQTQCSDENSVRPSVCLSHAWITELWQMVERSVYIYIPYERSFSLVFWEEGRLVGATPSTWNVGSTDPRWSKITDFQPIFAHSSSAVTPSEKSSINTNRKPTTCFPMSLRWSSYVAPQVPQMGSQKHKTANFWVKSGDYHRPSGMTNYLTGPNRTTPQSALNIYFLPPTPGQSLILSLTYKLQTRLIIDVQEKLLTSIQLWRICFKANSLLISGICRLRRAPI